MNAPFFLTQFTSLCVNLQIKWSLKRFLINCLKSEFGKMAERERSFSPFLIFYSHTLKLTFKINADDDEILSSSHRIKYSHTQFHFKHFEWKIFQFEFYILSYTDPPEIVVDIPIVYSGENQEATLSCIVHGETQPEVIIELMIIGRERFDIY